MKKRFFVTLVCMLMIGSIAVPVLASGASKTPSQSLSRGTIFYVGGSGIGNYSKIQDAIDNASDGDTVFVYDDSSPYLENLVVHVSISLVGEEKETTIIDGTMSNNTVEIKADDVTITGFTLQNGNESAICLYSNHNTITDNIITESLYAISIDMKNYTLNLSENKGYNTITNNRIIDNAGGIFLVCQWNNTISGNTFSQSQFAITLLGVANTNISLNRISENMIGIFLIYSYNAKIYRNHISNNSGYGISTFDTFGDKILQNNFIGNNQSAITHQSLLNKIQTLHHRLHFPIRRNVWSQNFWDGPRQLPYMIPGVIMKFGLQIDWRPAQEPYDVP